MSMSFFNHIPQAPPDPIFALTSRYKADTTPEKINVGVGAYRTNEGKPWVLPVVKKAKKILLEDPSMDHEYLPMTGYAPFVQAAKKLVLGDAVPLENVGSVQAISGTGSLRLFAEFGRKFAFCPRILLPNPSWANHQHIFTSAGYTVDTYRYWDPETKGLAFEAMIEDLNRQAAGTIIVLHGCAHNPTGVDPTREQWMEIGKVVKKNNLLVLFDIAYQGFATGDLGGDAFPIRHFAKEGMEIFIAQSFSKNFGLYGERAGCLHAVTASPEIAKKIQSQVGRVSRGIVSNCPSFGAKIVTLVLNDQQLYEEWVDSLQVMSKRILEMRQGVKEGLEKLGTPGDWSHVTRQIGMFSYTGLSPAQCDVLTDKFHIYLTRNGRISLAGLNPGNIDRFCQSIDWVVRNVKA